MLFMLKLGIFTFFYKILAKKNILGYYILHINISVGINNAITH